MDTTDRRRRVTLQMLAAEINIRFRDLEAVAKPGAGYCNTDRKIPGTRLRHPGKGRRGTLLIVTDRATGQEVYRHNAAETYRRNSDVTNWIQRRNVTEHQRRKAKQEGRGQ